MLDSTISIGVFLISITGYENEVRALIELGATVDIQDANKQTPLHKAAENGKSNIWSHAFIYYFIVFLVWFYFSFWPFYDE